MRVVVLTIVGVLLILLSLGFFAIVLFFIFGEKKDWFWAFGSSLGGISTLLYGIWMFMLLKKDMKDVSVPPSNESMELEEELNH